MDFKSMRLKKNENLANAMENVRKDLYEWKPIRNVYNINKNKVSSANYPPQKLKSLETPLSPILKRSDSLNELNKTNSIRNSGKSKKSFESGANVPKNETSDFRNDFLKNFRGSVNDLNEDKFYLNSFRESTVNRNPEEIEKELVIFQIKIKIFK